MSGQDDGVSFLEGESLPHNPVLYHEVLQAMQPRSGSRYVDCTLGAGGHALGILETSSPDGLLLGLDLDPVALKLADTRLSAFADRVILRRASYSDLLDELDRIGWTSVDGILLDLGLSSMQLDTGGRGFSFQADAPLDMRFDPDNEVTAAKLVNELSEAELAELLYKYGEERHSRKIARAIVAARPIRTTKELAEIVSSAVPGRSQRSSYGRPGIHPATLTFQALRIAVNRELDALQEVLPQAVSALASGGVLVVIAYHSLEDRLVKRFFRQESKDCICPPNIPVCVCGHQAQIVRMQRKPIRPTKDEVSRNPRSRSARMRAVKKI
jgi:16S rRNA (cytosine1402-N4)-methyltransferase